MKIEYRYHSGDVEEAFRAVRSRAWKKARIRVLLLSAVIFLALATLAWLDPQNPLLLLLTGIYVGAMSVVFGSWRRAMKLSRGVWKAYPIMQYKFTTEIDSDGIKTICDIANSMRRWECFTGYFETPNLFHIQEGQRVLWIPKRAFAGEAEINQMRDLLHSKLSCTTT